MKNKITVMITVAALLMASYSQGQQLNWHNFKNNKTHVVNINAGWDYGMVAGLGYGQKLKTKLPVVLSLEYSAPVGKEFFDDFKTKLGGQSALLQVDHFSAIVKAYGIYRRFENDYVRLDNFGSEFSTTIGYYKKSWFVAGEFGFDKAIVTHIKNSDLMKENYPGSENGWYVPTGGNFFYGASAGYSLRASDLYVKMGKLSVQDFKSSPTIPWYVQVGYNISF
jgi:hypothetical protein